jgi:predicted O-methyltransferase YrrM
VKDLLETDLQNFIKNILPEKDELELEIQKYAEENHVSIVEEEVANFLKVITGIKKPEKILEIGTGLGFSTINMAKSLGEKGKITTIELLKGRMEKAAYFIEKSGEKEKIKMIHGDGREIINQLDETFDIIFLDAAKGQYGKFLEKCDSLLNDNGIIIADNVLINGWVVNLEYPERRKKTMVVNMRNFLEGFRNNEKYELTLIPLGDGVALIRKR